MGILLGTEERPQQRCVMINGATAPCPTSSRSCRAFHRASSVYESEVSYRARCHAPRLRSRQWRQSETLRTHESLLSRIARSGDGVTGVAGHTGSHLELEALTRGTQNRTEQRAGLAADRRTGRQVDEAAVASVFRAVARFDSGLAGAGLTGAAAAQRLRGVSANYERLLGGMLADNHPS